MTEYKPGTVAVATVRGVPNVRVFRNKAGWWSVGTPDGKGGVNSVAFDSHVTDIRPLVVLDLGDYKPHAFAEDLREVLEFTVGHRLADQIEQQTRPPKPPEPTRWGAVVEDRTGAYWTLIAPEAGVFVNYREGRRVYADVDAVRVAHEGMQP